MAPPATYLRPLPCAHVHCHFAAEQWLGRVGVGGRSGSKQASNPEGQVAPGNQLLLFALLALVALQAK